MKKYSLIVILFCILTFQGCGNDSGSPLDSISPFRSFSDNLRNLSHNEWIVTTNGASVSQQNNSGDFDDYLIASEDLYTQKNYCETIFNRVIDFKVLGTSDSLTTNTDMDATVTNTGGVYTYKSDYYIYLETGKTYEKIHVEYTFNSQNNRWLLISKRGGNATMDPNEPWIRQEGEKVSDSVYAISTTFFYHEEGKRHVNNAIFTFGTTNSLQMACERETCSSDCVDLTSNTFTLYNQGTAASGLATWNALKAYRVTDGTPDYEIP